MLFGLKYHWYSIDKWKCVLDEDDNYIKENRCVEFEWKLSLYNNYTFQRERNMMIRSIYYGNIVKLKRIKNENCELRKKKL